jgi:hypothetical protein
MSDGKRVHQVNHHLFALYGNQTLPNALGSCLRCGVSYAAAVSGCPLSKKENESAGEPAGRDPAKELLAFLDCWYGEARTPPMQCWRDAIADAKAIVAKLDEVEAEAEAEVKRLNDYALAVEEDCVVLMRRLAPERPLKVADIEEATRYAKALLKKYEGQEIEPKPNFVIEVREPKTDERPPRPAADLLQNYPASTGAVSAKTTGEKRPQPRTLNDDDGHSFPLRGDQTEPDEVAHCAHCGWSYAGIPIGWSCKQTQADNSRRAQARKPAGPVPACCLCQHYDGLSVAGTTLCLHHLGYDACRGQGHHLFYMEKEQELE